MQEYSSCSSCVYMIDIDIKMAKAYYERAKAV